jgi:hypothetical protein
MQFELRISKRCQRSFSQWKTIPITGKRNHLTFWKKVLKLQVKPELCQLSTCEKSSKSGPRVNLSLSKLQKTKSFFELELKKKISIYVYFFIFYLSIFFNKFMYLSSFLCLSLYMLCQNFFIYGIFLLSLSVFIE